MRDMIARALTRSAGAYEVVAAVGTGEEAIDSCRRLKPDVVVLDINLPDRNGVEAVPAIRRVSPQTRILLCTAFPKEDWFAEAAKSGADGFVEKTNTWEDFLVAVDRVSRGQRYFCSGETSNSAPSTSSSAALLSAREREVLQLIARGSTSKEIARELGVSLTTIETHRANMISKTQTRNAADLVRFAIKSGLVSEQG